MATIRWKEGKIISIALKDNSYVLAQMSTSPFLIIFNYFNHNEDWQIQNISNKDVLFIQGVTRQFFKNTKIIVQSHIVAVAEIAYQKYWIKEDPSSRMVTIWSDTEDQMTFFSLGKGGVALIENDITKTGFKEEQVVIENITETNAAIMDNYELTNLGSYPEFNERLFLCSKFRKNINPAKDLLFNQELPLEYKDYFSIVSGLIPIAELGY